jgi:hypothetical protein
MSVRTFLRFVFVSSLIMVALFAGGQSVVAQASTSIERFTIPFSIDDVNPCTGEPITLSGELNITNVVTADANGGFHFNYTLVPSQVRGVGASGATYKAVGGEREHFNVTAGETLNDTYTNTFNLISQGGGDNFIVHVTFHVTVDANGDVTAEVVLDSAECRG